MNLSNFLLNDFKSKEVNLLKKKALFDIVKAYNGEEAVKKFK